MAKQWMNFHHMLQTQSKCKVKHKVKVEKSTDKNGHYYLYIKGSNCSSIYVLDVIQYGILYQYKNTNSTYLII